MRFELSDPRPFIFDIAVYLRYTHSMHDEETKLLTPIPLRLSPELQRRIEIFRRTQIGGTTLSMAQAMRVLMELGLDTVLVAKKRKHKRR
jgi:hypothetical protein